MKNIKLKWVRTTLVGSVSAQRPRGTPYVLSYLAILQPLIQQMPTGGFASPEGISQLKIGMALDAIVSQNTEAIIRYETAVDRIQQEMQALAKAGVTPEQVQQIRDQTWDLELPESIDLLLEDAQHTLLVKLLDRAEFNVPTLAVGEMVEEIKAAPSVEVTPKR